MIVTKGHVVQRHFSRGPGRFVSETRQYEDALADFRGRGFLGFENVLVTDEYTGVTRVFRFDRTPVDVGPDTKYRHYPRLGRATSTGTTDPGTGANHAPGLADAVGTVATPRTSWSADFSGHPLRMTAERTAAFNDGALRDGAGAASHVANDVTFDDWGNPKTVVTTTTDNSGAPARVYTRTVTTDFANTVASWRIPGSDQEGFVDVSSANAGADSYQGDLADGSAVAASTRTTSFSYDSLGRIEWMFREPDAAVVNDGKASRLRLFRGSGGLAISEKLYGATGKQCGGAPCGTGQLWMHRLVGAAPCSASAIAGPTNSNTTRRAASQRGSPTASVHTRWTLYDPARMWPYASVDVK